MGIFVGTSKNTAAVRTALKINYAVDQIIRPLFAGFYKNLAFTLKHVVGIDTSTLHAARIGIRGDNDIVWVGRAANVAAKLCSLSEKPIWITEEVYQAIHRQVRFSTENEFTGINMWQLRYWREYRNKPIYGTEWHRRFD